MDISGGQYSFVEGSEFNDAQSEIDALGGDAFFLGKDEIDGTNPKTNVCTGNKRDVGFSTLKFEWDGEVDEDAHLDVDNDEDGDE